MNEDIQNGTVSSFLSIDGIWFASLYVILGIFVFYSIQSNRNIQTQLDSIKEQLINSTSKQSIHRPIAWITGDNIEIGYLHHVIEIFKKIGFVVWTKSKPPTKQEGEWLILWTHEYPFAPQFNLPQLESFQKVNHFPGSGFITNKVNLATSGLKHIPKAFNLPDQKEEFLNFAQENPEKLWVQKDNTHRGIRVKSIENLNLDKKGTFIQEFIQNPLLIDGKKFDIGLYVTLTSINPLRLYLYSNEVLLRFCARQYPFPFNESDVDSYVVGDQYTPIWNIPSLAKYYVGLNMNMKASLNAYIKFQLNLDPQSMWNAMEESIKTIYYLKEEKLLNSAKSFEDTRNFFEMVRFDFALDDQLNVYLMEANMSPNLASAKFPANRLIYEPVIYNTLSLAGITQMPLMMKTWTNKREKLWNMFVNDKDLSILPDICQQTACDPSNSSSCQDDQCDACLHCISDQFKLILKDCYMEEMHRGHYRRLIPSTSKESPITLGHNNYLQDKWFIGKCLEDDKWCN
ncbi:serine/threonine protein phosphatase [Sarcoptes scabiei]|nr:serine/threonine protein phosphatase [Sarcoptes scabiei]